MKFQKNTSPLNDKGKDFINKIIIGNNIKKKFFKKLINKLKNNNLLEHKLHLLVGTDIFENSFFKNDNLLNYINNHKRKSNSIFSFLLDTYRFFLLISKIIFFKFLTPKNYIKKSNKKKTLILSYLPQTNFFDNSNNFISYQWGNNLDYIINNNDCEYLHIFNLNFSTLKRLFNHSFKKHKLNNSSHLFFLNYISVREILCLVFITLFQKKIRIKNQDPIGTYISESTKSHCLIESRIWEKIFLNFFTINKNYKRCFYLFENQNWEKFLNYYWKYFINKDIYPFNHSACRYNDYRTFSSIYFSKFKIIKNYFPNKIVIDDNISLKNIKSFDKKFKILKINNSEKKLNFNYKNNKIALVIGDIDLITSKNLLNISLELKKNNILSKVIYKPHPSNIKRFINNDYDLYLKELNYFNKSINYVFCANSTTTASKIYQSFSNLFVYIPKNKINLSPLLNVDNKIFYSDYDNLLHLIMNSQKKPYNQKSIYYKNLKSKIFSIRNN